MKTLIVIPWHNSKQLTQFAEAWGVKFNDDRFIFQHDAHKEGCAVTKNKGVRNAVKAGADVVIVLDDDCYPAEGQTVDSFIADHIAALQPVEVPLVESTGFPRTRGTPYYCTTVTMPVACSMGFWTVIPDYDAVHQLVEKNGEDFNPYYGVKWKTYFPLCGMNIAFKPKDWLPWCSFINVPRFDDIWMGWLWQKKAYSLGYCFNLQGPTVRHVRQSNVWKNLIDEARYLEASDSLWKKIHECPSMAYNTLRALLPVQ